MSEDADKNKIPAQPGTEGQNPLWPGEGLKQPGTKVTGDDGDDDADDNETTTIPIVR